MLVPKGMQYVGIPHEDGTGMLCWIGDPWHHAVMAIAKRQDGKIVRVRLNQQPDSWFSWPGRASYKRTTVKGFVSADSDIDPQSLCWHYNTSDLQDAMRIYG